MDNKHRQWTLSDCSLLLLDFQTNKLCDKSKCPIDVALVPMQKERDAEHMSLTKEMKHWQQVTQEQKLQNEIVQKTMERGVYRSEEEILEESWWWMDEWMVA